MTVDPAVQELLDKQALTELVATYCRGVDRVDPELLASIYHPDALIEHGPFRGDPQGFIEHVFNDSAAARAEATVHTALTSLFEIRGDVAYGETRFIALLSNLTEDESRAQIVQAAGRYFDRYERRNGTWKIAHRRTVRDIDNLVDERDVSGRGGTKYYGRRDGGDVSYDRAW